MKSKSLKLVLSFFLTILFIFYSAQPNAKCSGYTVDEIQYFIDGIISYKLSESSSSNIQEWIDNELTSGAGTTSDWYIISLSQNGYTDFSSYENSLINYLDNKNIASASSRLKYALALSASGSNSKYIQEFLDNSPGQQGIMSWIYGLHVLNNGYTSDIYNISNVTDTLLSLQYSDGGWAIFGDNGDIDVTAMTIQALAPYYYSNYDVQNAINKGLDFLSQHQQEDGGYISYGTPNPESASQVLVALSALGIDCQSDERFIKNEKTIINSISDYRLDNGGFRHTIDGDYNETASIQALYSLISYKRMLNGQGAFLILDNKNLQNTPEIEVTEEVITTEIPESSTYISENIQTEEIFDTVINTTVATSSDFASTSNSTKFVTTTKTTTYKTTPPVTTITSTTYQAPADFSESNYNYKPLAVIIIISSGIILSIVLFLCGKRNKKNFIFIAILTGIFIVFIICTDFKSTEEYYNKQDIQKENASGTVSIEIHCDTVIGKSDSDYIPADGVILEKSYFEIEPDETVFDILTEAAQKYNIQIENKGSAGSAHGMAYIAGINYLYEFDFGELSGWVYHVNGITPSIGCGEYILNDGDCIEWLYTCELGHDLNEVYG